MKKENLVVNRWKAFGYARKGLLLFFKTEKSAWIHLATAILVISAAFYFQLSSIEWISVIFAIGFVIVTEILNTSIEELVDLVQPDFHPMAGKVKDYGAAAVYISVITSIIIAGIVFIPKILNLFE